MERHAARLDFASDNTAGICPEALRAIAEANAGAAASYGDDEWSARLRERVQTLFERDCEVYTVLNGTAANSLGLAQICQAHHAIVCHRYAHIQTDECGAPEFFSGGAKLLLTDGRDGKIDISSAEAAVARQVELHGQQPRALSLAEATELGTIYTPDEISALGEFARRVSLLLHMDGARFANAVAALGCAPKKITWQAGVDVLSFGGTKNGLAAGDLVVFFDRTLARDFDRRVKQGAQLASKTRFLAAPWLALLADDLWLRNARHANAMAKRLAERLRDEAKLESVLPCEANAVFVRLDKNSADRLRARGWDFYSFIDADICRFMCSWATTQRAVDEFVAAVAGLRA